MIATDFGISASSGYIHKDFMIAGVECEIESVKIGQSFTNFNAEADGSLRNSGIEYISLPLSSGDLLESFTNLHAKIKLTNPSEAFSSRTSTHVHVNCLGFEKEEVKNLVLLYALYEEVFFCMVDSNRRGNIHCVPLTETHLPSLYRQPFDYLLKKWHKYTALNIVPIGKQGTVEFRHLQGTGDPIVFKEWLTTLENLWLLAQQEQINETNINDDITLDRWFVTIFGHSPKVRALRYSYKELIKNSLLDVKLSLIK